MNWRKEVLIVSLAAVCFGCQGPAKKVEQAQVPAAKEVAKPAEAAHPAAVVPVNPKVEQLNKLLIEAAVYDYDKSRVALSETSELIRNTSGESRKLVEKRLDGFLKSDATQAGKDFVCRELSIIGTQESVPTLAEMLTDEKTSDMARYALERIPAAAVDDVLIDSLGKTSGKVKVRIINTLGERRNSKCVTTLAGLIYDNDGAVASAAVAAVGKIGGFEAAKVLFEASKKKSGELRNVVLHSYLDCANLFAANGERVQAVLIYQRLYDSNEPLQIRIAALRGIATATGDMSVGILAEALKKNEPAMQSAAIVLVREVPAPEILKMAAAELPNFGPVAKAQMLTALSNCGYSAALPEMIAAAKDTDASVRLAVLKAIGKIGNASNVPLLAERAANGPADERQVARESLYRLRGADVDKVILSAMDGAEAKVKVELIRAIGERNITSAAESLLTTAKDTDQKVRVESVKALRIVGRPEQLAAIIELLKNPQSDTESAGLEKTVAAVAGRINDPNQRASAVISAMETVTDPTTKCAFISVLGRIGGSNALAAVRSTLKDSDEKVQAAAIRVLTDWTTPEPMDDLLQVVQNSPNKTYQILALRGYIRLTGLDSPRPAEETIKLYNQAIKLSPGVEEKKMVLAGLSNMKTYAAIEAAAGFLNDSELQEEAAIAMVQIAKKTKGEDNQEQTKAALNKVLEIAKTEQLRKQAEEVLSKIK